MCSLQNCCTYTADRRQDCREVTSRPFFVSDFEKCRNTPGSLSIRRNRETVFYLFELFGDKAVLL